MPKTYNLKGAKRRYSVLSASTYKCKFAQYMIYVDITYSVKPSISSDKMLPQEIRDAINIWIDNGLCNSIELADYLNKMFNRLDYI